MKKLVPEVRIRAEIRRHLDSLWPDGYFFAYPGTALGQAGTPDFIGCYFGRFVAIEIKRPGERPKPHQSSVQSMIQRTGGCCCVAMSVEQVKEFLSVVDLKRRL